VFFFVLNFVLFYSLHNKLGETLQQQQQQQQQNNKNKK
jgi:hypothetical protein